MIALKYKLPRLYRLTLKKEKYIPPNFRYFVTSDVKPFTLQGKKGPKVETRKSSHSIMNMKNKNVHSSISLFLSFAGALFKLVIPPTSGHSLLIVHF